ncbi:hypothetical protein E2C01_092819 [Portunus trituberculatus]|uniref:Uncharacterized protein n=1 Tax=Portunus trituberculatus TaxID=210409 RepID=A0A5B7JHF0_PORTR|nr:hypothetical protein [Portunus trituberculatus]
MAHIYYGISDRTNVVFSEA